MVLLAAWCSLRFGELASLRRARVGLLHRTIRVEEYAVEPSSGRTVFGPPKTEAGRSTVSIPAVLVPALERHLAEHTGSSDPDAPVFTSSEGHPLRRTKFRPRWITACPAAGVTASISTTYGAPAPPGPLMGAPQWRS